jgi:hypothetical protein
MFNLPTIDVDNFSVGGGVLFIGPVGATPTIDVGTTGFVSFLSIGRAAEKVQVGAPIHNVDFIATEETAFLSVVGLEWNLSNISRVIGAGVTTHTAVEERLALGGEQTFDKFAVLFRHVTKAGHTIFVKLWEASGGGLTDISFSGDSVHQFVNLFEAHDATTDWAGDSLGENRRLYEIERNLGPSATVIVSVTVAANPLTVTVTQHGRKAELDFVRAMKDSPLT